MPDGNLFAANPDDIKQGGHITDQLAEIAANIYKNYNHFYIDWNSDSNPIGERGDPSVDALANNYSPAYNDEVQALGQVIDAIRSASDLTTQSGVNFNLTQQDALDQINSVKSGRSA
ncbi:hypothetical protein ACWDR3_39595 [Streptomyces sp. NPDC001002]